MGKILGISIENYGVLRNVKLGRLFRDSSRSKSAGKTALDELGDLVAIIGPNGAGKSTVADAFGFVADCLASDVEAACDANFRGGFSRLRSQGSDEPIRFEIYYREAPKISPITYELTIGADEFGRPFVKEEILRQRRRGGTGYPLTFLRLREGKGFVFEGVSGGEDEKSKKDVDGTRTEVELNESRKLGIVTLGAMKQYPRVANFLAFLRDWYLCYFTPDAARQTQTTAPTQYLNRTGSNLNNVAQFMWRENKERFEKILQGIRTKIPNVAKIEPLELPNGQMALQFFQSDLDRPFFSPRMSDGTLKLFAYYLLMNEKTPRRLVFIEEPENGLYHRDMADLAREMARNAGSEKQIFVTTHSPFFVNALKPEQIWVLEKGPDGFSQAKRASEYDFVVDMFREDVRAGDLWYDRYFG